MANSLYEMCLQEIVVVVFNTNIQSTMMNATGMFHKELAISPMKACTQRIMVGICITPTTSLRLSAQHCSGLLMIP